MLCAAALLGAGPAGAQESLGELLDRGAVKMTRAELVAALQNTVMSGDSLRRQGGAVRFEYSPDGTVTGVFRNDNGEFRHAGTWRVEDSGLFVRETTVTPGGDRRTERRFFYRLGDAYYAAEPTDERDAKVFKRLFEPRQ